MKATLHEEIHIAYMYINTLYTFVDSSFRRNAQKRGIRNPGSTHDIHGLLLTYGLATRHACYAPATRPLRAVDLHVWFSQDEEVFTQQVK